MAVYLFLSNALVWPWENLSSAPPSLTVYSQIHDSCRQRQSIALAEVFGCCDSDDGLDADNENGHVVVLFGVLYTKPV